MANTTIGIAAALIVIGVVGYVATDRQSATALIPAFLGLLLLAFGWLARNAAYRKHAMHAVAVFALLGLLGTVRRPHPAARRHHDPGRDLAGTDGNPDRRTPCALRQVLHRRSKTEGARLTSASGRLKPASLHPQRRHRMKPRRPPRGDRARQDRDDEHRRRGPRDDERVAARHLIQLARQQPRDAHRTGQSRPATPPSSG